MTAGVKAPIGNDGNTTMGGLSEFWCKDGQIKTAPSNIKQALEPPRRSTWLMNKD